RRHSPSRRLTRSPPPRPSHHLRRRQRNQSVFNQSPQSPVPVDLPPARSTIQQEDEMTRNQVLWVIQGLLAELFLFAGVLKLVLPIEAMTGHVTMPGAFVGFI